jgi:hypothetical protein
VLQLSVYHFRTRRRAGDITEQEQQALDAAMPLHEAMSAQQCQSDLTVMVQRLRELRQRLGGPTTAVRGTIGVKRKLGESHSN